MGRDPTTQLPAYVLLSRETHAALMAFWSSVGGRTLTDAEVQAIVGEPGSAPRIPREFGTGEIPYSGTRR